MVVGEGDWLKTQRENGETFSQYVGARPTLPTAERRTIYIQPVGSFTPEQREILRLTRDYMEAFFGLPVKLRADAKLGNVPESMTRKQYRNRQIRTSYFLDTLLPKMLPPDAAAFVCFTNIDLYPEETWNFVFGQANLETRVGVWSLYRLAGKGVAREQFLDRTLKIAAHETGHMFSMRHCTKYECLMSGTNSLPETDRRPVDACPECTAKIVWAMNVEPAARFHKMADFFRMLGRDEDAAEFEKKAAAIAAVME